MTGARVVAIDGAAGSGKSTLARGLARRLHLSYIDTGAMYRAVAAAALRAAIDPADGPALLELARRSRFRLVDGDPPALEVEGWSAADLRTMEVESTVSEISSHPAIRAHLRGVQRRLAASGAVMEGRDIGSVVFPDAAVKLFVTADADARIRRRTAERAAHDTLRAKADGAIGDALHSRDERDARTNPLRPAPDAIVLDTTHLEVGPAIEAAFAIVRREAPELVP